MANKSVTDIKSGDKFGRLTVVRRTKTKPFFQCQCSCGKSCESNGYNLLSGNTKSCRCKRKESAAKGHKSDKRMVGMRKHPLYDKHRAMVARCHNSNNPRYYDYGGRGIRVCRRWRDSFLEFYDWTLANGWKPGLEIDRKDNNKGYTPVNCRYVTRKVNLNNTRSNKVVNIKGESINLSQAIKKYSFVNVETVRRRVKAGWSVEEAMLTPPKTGKFKNRSLSKDLEDSV